MKSSKRARPFIGRRRATRPGEEYCSPADEEWDAFLGHFEKRKPSIGTCDRAFSTPCIHEHARKMPTFTKIARRTNANAT